MKNDLTCAVVQDLLPNYLEGLTSGETNAAIQAHLNACPDCAARLSAMREQDILPSEQAREVDYLKTVKRKNRRRVVLAVLCTVLLGIAGFALKLFVIGTPATREGMSWSVQQEGEALNLRVFTEWSGVAYCRWNVEQDGQTVYITASKVLPSPLYQDADERLRISLAGVREVWLCGKLLWQDGVTVFESTVDLLAAGTPYTGDAAALNQIASLLHIRPHLGDFTHTLQTSREPYRWTLDFTGEGGVFNESAIDQNMTEYYAPLMLALVENLGEVGWTYTDRKGIFHTGSIPLEEVDARLPELFAAYNQQNGTDWTPLPSIKDYAQSPSSMQKLLEVLDVLGL